MLVLDEVAGRHMIAASGNVGTIWPFHATSTGKAYIALEEDGLNRLGDNLLPLTGNTLITRESFEPLLYEIRRKGYAVSVDELEEGFTAVATVIRGALGDVQGALAIGGPTQRLGPARRAQLGVSLCHAAARLSPEF